jgi:peptide/nickel transport system ATP-binding protein
MIFQDPHASLSPRQRVENLLLEPYEINRIPPAERYSVEELLSMVGLSHDLSRKYPHELSGGQARRVGIARALAPQPDLVIADEPTAGLDVSAASAVLNLMCDLRDRLGLTYLVITHNLSLVSYLADRIGVMYLGQLVEIGPTERVLESPAHPYTRALLATAPELDLRRRSQRRRLLRGEIPSPTDPPSGCRFHSRCTFAEPRSSEETPVLEEIEPRHFVACHFWRKVQVEEPEPFGALPLEEVEASMPTTSS